MRACSLPILAVLLLTSVSQGQQPPQTKVSECQEAESEEWIQLFNGMDLSGWTPKICGYEVGDNFGETFRVEDGLLKVSYEHYDDFDGKFGHLFFNESFSNYRLRLEYRFVGEQAPNGPGWAIRNSGVMVHGQDPATMGKDQKFPVSIEVQLLGGNGQDPRTTGNLCTPGTHVVMEGELVKRHCTTSSSLTYHGEQWVVAEIEVRGGKVIRHIIEGEEVLSYQKPQLDPGDGDAKVLIENGDGELLLTGGTISLQSESHPVHFRKVELLRLVDSEGE